MPLEDSAGSGLIERPVVLQELRLLAETGEPGCRRGVGGVLRDLFQEGPASIALELLAVPEEDLRERDPALRAVDLVLRGVVHEFAPLAVERGGKALRDVGL